MENGESYEAYGTAYTHVLQANILTCPESKIPIKKASTYKFAFSIQIQLEVIKELFT